MSHSHHHDHGTENVSDAALLWAVGLNVGLSVFEGVAGALAGSVALYADALHNFNDCAALLIAYFARRIGRARPDARYTFGRRRAELVGALINLTALIVVGLFLIKTAVMRFASPVEPLGGWIMIASLIALVVDVGTVVLLWSMSKGGLNIRAAFVHNLTDALASLAVLGGGAAIYWRGWNWVDPAISLLIGGYVLFTSFGMMRQTAHILMEGAPDHLDLDHLCVAVEHLDGVENIHHLHVWQLDEHHTALEAHIVVQANQLPQGHALLERVRTLLEQKFDITHATLELETSAHPCGSTERYPAHHH
ncbi:cation diffusion facilitator family transporter [Synoicihabitans lomoniglobus]|uniref:Cation diffusion facilitator family transporter n=1 Tax=Synoicihabitans lomoniglobus TaxID=2909285 RepID=A0AAF0I7A0_9BACT|nr:cation diffusion facilitator family transporter [Opitutaceae bacterium LMO-M01]WED66586.1 cation diffusion facilitator family transporter [Opitutaceae bacterium LMO-M01]